MVFNQTLKTRPKIGTKMPKVEFDYVDIFAPVLVALLFAVILFIISFTCINWYCITHKDDLTVFEKLGIRLNLRLGPHTMAQINRGGYASTYAREEEGATAATAGQHLLLKMDNGKDQN